MAAGKVEEGQTRRSILQGLQQTRSRLQKLQEDRSPSPLNSIIPIAPPTAPPPPPPSVQTDPSLYSKQQKIAIQQAQSQSQGYYISEPSPHGNILIPILPRFDKTGTLIPMS